MYVWYGMVWHGMACGVRRYIPLGYWHWVFSESKIGEAAIALNIWTGKPHRGEGSA